MTAADNAMKSPVRNLTMRELEAGLQLIPPQPTEIGQLKLIVWRPKGGVREQLERATLTTEGGLVGDAWGLVKSPDPQAQLAVMCAPVAELIANGQALPTFGDNLYVAFDISTPNLPPGSRLRVGDAVVEVTPMAHTGCSKFRQRFGGDAFKFVNAKPNQHLNLRGVYWRVIEGAEVRPGAKIEVLSRPASGSSPIVRPRTIQV